MDGGDTFKVDDTFAGVILTLNGEGSNDTFFDISSTPRSLDTIDGDVIVDGATAPYTLNTHDQTNTLARTYTVTSDSVDRDASATIYYYGAVERLNLYGGGPYGTYNVESTAAGVTTTIVGGTDTDSFRVSPTAHHFNNIAGSLTISGGAGTANVLSILRRLYPRPQDLHGDGLERHGRIGHGELQLPERQQSREPLRLRRQQPRRRDVQRREHGPQHHGDDLRE